MPATAGPAYEAGCATVPAGPPRAGSPCRAGTLGNPAATALFGYLHHRPSAAGTITLPHVGVNGVAWGVHTLPTDDMSSWIRSRQHPACIRITNDHGMLRHSSASCTLPDGTTRPWLSGRRSRFWLDIIRTRRSQKQPQRYHHRQDTRRVLYTPSKRS